MTTARERVSALKISSFLAILTLVGIVAVEGSRVLGSAVALPRVTSVVQITHDGFNKTSLLSDDSHLYVSESPAAHHVIARVSLPNSDRSVIRSTFSDLQALDVSADHTKLLVSPGRSGSCDNEFWALPIHNGSPLLVVNLSGRDGAWSADGRQLAFSKGSILYLTSYNGSHARSLFTAY